MLPFLGVACFGGATFFEALTGAGAALRDGVAGAFVGTDFLAANGLFAARCGLAVTFAAGFFAEVGTFTGTAFFGAAFLGAGFFGASFLDTVFLGIDFFGVALTAFLTGVVAFFGTGFFALAGVVGLAFFLAGLADLRFDVAIIHPRCRSAVAFYSPIASARQPLRMLHPPQILSTNRDISP
ncbi:MAG: hypothetical protein JSR65_11865 [Proteobacteria bacterium]|nr:hypothetical protein [Pseudomonadota bacterium]